MDDLKYYVYAYLRVNGLPYYIGKGHGIRAFSHRGNSIKTPKDKSRIILLESNLTELGAFALERRLIRWWGRKDLGTGILYNRTDGGEGCAGIIPWNKNLQTPDIVKDKISNALSGLKRTGETKKLMSDERKGKLQTENRITHNMNQRRKDIFNWIHPINGEIICTTGKLMEMYNDVTKVGLAHVIYGYQNSHRGWRIKHG